MDRTTLIAVAIVLGILVAWVVSDGLTRTIVSLSAVALIGFALVAPSKKWLTTLAAMDAIVGSVVFLGAYFAVDLLLAYVPRIWQRR